MEFDESFMAQLEKGQQEMIDLTAQLEITMNLYDEVVERTGNFREGYYSHRKVSALAKTATKNMQEKLLEASNPHEQLKAMSDFQQDMRNVLATLMTEIDRIDY